MPNLCLQDTHIKPGSTETLFRKQWEGKCYFSSYKSSSRGVAILFGKYIGYNVLDVISDRNGNFLILDVTIETHRCTLAKIYGPNEGNEQFYDNVLTETEKKSKWYTDMG